MTAVTISSVPASALKLRALVTVLSINSAGYAKGAAAYKGLF
jgi:hypothetical protein